MMLLLGDLGSERAVVRRWKKKKKRHELKLFYMAGVHDLSLPRKLVLDRAVIVQEQWLALLGAEG